MSAGKAVRLFIVGLNLAVIAIGLLPFLLVYSWSDLYGISDLPPSSFPISLFNKFLK